MKKPLNNTTNYSISRNENEVLKILEETNNYIFEPQQVKRLTNWNDNKVNNTLQQLKIKSRLINIKKNLYILSNKLTEESFSISTKANEPAYISFWTALSYYGFTEQQPSTIQVVTRKRNGLIKTTHFNIEATHFKKEHFFGYTRVNNFSIAEPEKAIIDSFNYPDKAGGLKEVVNCLKNAKINEKVFLKYLKQFNNKSLNARIGYVYEILFNKKLHLELPSTYVKLNPLKSNGSRVKKWMVEVNEELI